jgi:hypothetical protein
MPLESWPFWRSDNNNVRPHSSLANKTPTEARRALNSLRASRTARFPSPKPTTIKPKYSRHERVTTGGQVIRGTDSRMARYKAVCIALGVTRDGEREILGQVGSENCPGNSFSDARTADKEGAKFWLSVMNELRKRGG